MIWYIITIGALVKDLLGVLSSSLCVVHCLLVPAVITAGVPLAGLAVLSGEKLHLALSLLVVLLAAWAFPSGWRRHRHALPGLLALFGIGFLLLTVFGADVLEIYSATLAAFCLIVAHLINRYFLLKKVIL